MIRFSWWKFSWIKMKCLVYLSVLLVGMSSEEDSSKWKRQFSTLNSMMKNFNFKTFDLNTRCSECYVIADTAIQMRRMNTSRESFRDILSKGCFAGAFFSAVDFDVCIGLIDMYLDTILYIIDHNPNLNGKQFCSVVVQFQDCPDKPPDWKIKVHGGYSVAKKPPSDSLPLNILHITDIHYDPLYAEGSNAECNRPLCCNKNPKDMMVSEEMEAGHWTDYRSCDIPDYFMVDTFRQISSKFRDISYVYFTGDIIAHDVWARTIQRNREDFTFTMDTFKRYFSDVEVYPVLGNHEPHPLNVFNPRYLDNTNLSTTWVFDLAADVWGQFLPSDTRETILRGGFYTAKTKDGLRIVSLNNNVGQCLNFWLVHEPFDPYGQLQWFADVMQKAEEAGENVHILTHTPNGDSYTNIPWAKEFRRIVLRYSNSITGIFNGHTHLDELEVIYNDEKPTNVIWNGGSLTPYIDLNPNYRIYKVNSGNFDVEDFDQYTINLDKANTRTTPPSWYKLYSFKQEYKVANLSAVSVAELAERMAGSSNLRQLYFRNQVRYARPMLEKGCDDDCQRTNLCNMVTSVYGDDKICKRLLKAMK